MAHAHTCMAVEDPEQQRSGTDIPLKRRRPCQVADEHAVLHACAAALPAALSDGEAEVRTAQCEGHLLGGV